MKWNLRLAAANRGIWKASELQHMLAEHGLVISAGKLSSSPNQRESKNQVLQRFPRLLLPATPALS